MGLIRRSFTYMDKSSFTTLFKSFVRPHLEYANATWDIRLKNTRNMIENVQRRATKCLSSCKGLSYVNRLEYLNLPCLAYRKLRGDLIEAFKLLANHYDEEAENPLSDKLSQNNRTRGHKLKLQKLTTRKTTTLRRRFFTNRITNFWNDLPEKVIAAPSVASFERRLDKYWEKYKIKFDYQKCMNFIDQTMSGVGALNLADDTNYTNADLDI